MTNWIPFPRLGTTLLGGRWLCTVIGGKEPRVEFLTLRADQWVRDDGKPLPRRKRVTAIATQPQPYVRPDGIAQQPGGAS